MSAYFYAAVFGLLIGIFLGTFIHVSSLIIPIIVISGFVLPYFRASSPKLFATGLFLLFFVVGVLRIGSVPNALSPPFKHLLNTRISFTGTIVEPIDHRETSDRLTVEVQQGTERTRILASVPPHSVFRAADRVRVVGILKLPEPFESEGGRVFRYDQFLAKEKIGALVQPARVQGIGQSHNLWLYFLRTLEALKNLFERALELALPEPESALAIGILVGGKQGLGAHLLEAFTIAGMLQIVVLSGYNVMIVAEGVLSMLQCVPRKYALSLAAFTITLFVLASGAGSSAVRAGIMALIALLGRATHRTYDVLRALFAALALMVFWNPLLLVYDPGLQLSFMATLGLVLGSKLLELRMLWITHATLREMLATTLAAQIAVLPLLLYQSGNLSLVAIPANLLAMPVLPAAMAASALAAVVAPVLSPLSPVLAAVAGIPAYLPLAYVIGVAEYAARVPYANVIAPAFPAWVLVPTYSLLGWWVWWQTNRERPSEFKSLRPRTGSPQLAN